MPFQPQQGRSPTQGTVVGVVSSLAHLHLDGIVRRTGRSVRADTDHQSIIPPVRMLKLANFVIDLTPSSGMSEMDVVGDGVGLRPSVNGSGAVGGAMLEDIDYERDSISSSGSFHSTLESLEDTQVSDIIKVV